MNATTISAKPEPEYVDNIVAVIVPVFFGLIAITGLIGNSLVILVVWANPQMRSTTNLLICNLAVADLLFVVFCIPFTAMDYVATRWPFGEAWCKIVQYLIVVTVMTSIYTLVLMSVDRYLAVVHPVHSRTVRTEKNTRIAIGILGIVVVTISIPVYIFHGLAEYTYNKETWLSCRLLIDGFSEQAAYHITFMVCSYALPLILISVLYIRMIARLWRTVGGSTMSRDSKRGRKRVTRLVVVVVVAFAALWLPIQIILLLKSIHVYEADSDATFQLFLQIVAQTLAYTSSCINPLLYAFLSENFRKAFHKAVYCSKFPLYTLQISNPRRSSYNGTSATAI